MLVRRCIDVRKRRLKNFHFQPKTNVNLTSETDVNVTSIQLILPAGKIALVTMTYTLKPEEETLM